MNRFRSIAQTTRPKGLLCVMSAWLAMSCLGSESVDEAPVVVTTLTGLNRLIKVDETIVISLQIEGTVWWSSKTEGRIILNDNTTALQLELNLPFPMPDLGERLMLEGECAATKTRDVIRLSREYSS